MNGDDGWNEAGLIALAGIGGVRRGLTGFHAGRRRPQRPLHLRVSSERGGGPAHAAFDLRRAGRYGVDEFEGDSIHISAAHGQAAVLSIPYQLADGLPQNQFSGGHGFTGLLYFTHPTGGGDYQAFCEAVR